MSYLLNGAYDLHFHTAPDVCERKCSDLTAAKRWKAAGMKGGLIKCHYADTTGRAAILRELFPDLNIAGGLVLNRQAGGLNPQAAERCGQAGGRFLWFPTLDAHCYQSFRHGQDIGCDPSPYLSILDCDGRLLPQVYEIFEVVKQYDMILCTGHLGSAEGITLLREASRLGVKRMAVTHADNPANLYSLDEQKECVALGAVIEHSYFTTYYNRTSWEELISQIRAVGASRIYLTTDFGQPDSPFSDEGMALYAAGLLEHGSTERELELMMCRNPEELLQR